MIECVCVQRHVPLPTSYKKIKVQGELVHLCPTTFANLMDLLTAFKVYATIPPGWFTKHYSKYVRELALNMWKENEKMTNA
jgi:hypothetical protein